MSNYTPSTPNNFLAVRAELDKIAVAIESQLDREGCSPNFMKAELDMNGFAILNYDIENSPLVSSVFGRTGVVTAQASDYSSYYLQDITAQSIGELADVSLSGNQIGYVLTWDGDKYVPSAAGGSVSNFTALTDTPNNYTGSANFVLTVNPTATGVVFTSNVDDLINTIDGGNF